MVEVHPDRGQGTVDVSAEADLGGFLVASRLPLFAGLTDPEATRVGAKVECTTNVVEVVLAFDVTHSMTASFGGARRIDVAVDAARALLDVLWSGCADAHIAVGIVPWDRTVRLPAPRTWEHNGWVDVSGYRSVPAGVENDWSGCIEDRRHTISAAQGSAGLSLALPEPAAFPRLPLSRYREPRPRDHRRRIRPARRRLARGGGESRGGRDPAAAPGDRRQPLGRAAAGRAR